MKIIVSGNSVEHLKKLIKKNIDGVIVSIDKLAVNGSFYMDVDMLDEIDFMGKEAFVSLNKLMHNKDLQLLREVMEKLKDRDVKILFYDMAVYQIAQNLGMVSKLVIYQEHLNASIGSHNFYNNLGITGSFVTNDITYQELMEIKEHTKMELMFLGYGYAPIFYSRRYLISNYLEYIGENGGKKYKIQSDNVIEYPISEEEFGTTIYTEEVINLINYLDKLDNIDYIVMNSLMIDDNDFLKMVDRFLNREKLSNCYLGFFDKKTIYKVK